MAGPKRVIVGTAGLPDKWPTHVLSPTFCEQLGRTVATYGFLEEVLARAIFALNTTKSKSDEQFEREFPAFVVALERTLTDPLGGLISRFKAAVQAHPQANITNLDEVILAMQSASYIRNALCHGSWRIPDEAGASIPLYVDRRTRTIWSRPVDEGFLLQTQASVVELITGVISTVTFMGYRFPGSDTPGQPVWPRGNSSSVDPQT